MFKQYSGVVKGVRSTPLSTKSPLAEQQRIVAKVDQLLALCDALSQHIGAAGKKRVQILDAVLARVGV